MNQLYFLLNSSFGKLLTVEHAVSALGNCVGSFHLTQSRVASSLTSTFLDIQWKRGLRFHMNILFGQKFIKGEAKKERLESYETEFFFFNLERNETIFSGRQPWLKINKSILINHQSFSPPNLHQSWSKFSLLMFSFISWKHFFMSRK